MKTTQARACLDRNAPLQEFYAVTDPRIPNVVLYVAKVGKAQIVTEDTPIYIICDGFALPMGNLSMLDNASIVSGIRHLYVSSPDSVRATIAGKLRAELARDQTPKMGEAYFVGGDTLEQVAAHYAVIDADKIAKQRAERAAHLEAAQKSYNALDGARQRFANGEEITPVEFLILCDMLGFPVRGQTKNFVQTRVTYIKSNAYGGYRGSKSQVIWKHIQLLRDKARDPLPLPPELQNAPLSI